MYGSFTPLERNGFSSQQILGTIARKVSPPSTGRSTRQRLGGKTNEQAEAAKINRLLRWALQAEARAILPHERVAECLRKMNPIATFVEVLHNTEHQVAHYKSLIVCGSVWLCPLCAAKISERRREELIRAITSHIEQNGAVYMATYTISHSRFDSLSCLLQAFLRARKRLKEGKYAQWRKHDVGVVGTISVLEVTWSMLNSWHPHIHELIFILRHGADMTGYEAESRAAWRRAAAHEGLHMNEHGYRLVH